MAAIGDFRRGVSATTSVRDRAMRYMHRFTIF